MKRLVCALVLGYALAAQGGEGKRLLWGDTHLHTSNSMDAFTVGNFSADPETAYRYARGLPAIHPYHRARVRIGTPLDFLAVTDHAEFMGVIPHLYREGVPREGLGLLESITAIWSTWVLRLAIDHDWGPLLFGSRLPDPQEAAVAASRQADEGFRLTGIPPLPGVEAAAWRRITATADAFNEPGVFSALIGWEWSSNPGGANLHRIVLTDSGAAAAQQYRPFSFIDSPYPEDLWRWLEQTSARTGAGFIAIPHNSNISKGLMFATRTLRGAPFSPDYIAARMKWERIAEVTQIKGDSETHPDLSPEDEFADFETYPFYIQREAAPYEAKAGDYIRSALVRGLALEAELGLNPYQFGLIGSSDAHTGMASAEEDNFHGKMPRDSVPENKASRFAGRETAPSGWDMSASGLAAVWAEDNTRGAILAAMQRREVYATSGPRIGVQFFAGYDFGDDILAAGDLYERATATGVPMGGDIQAAGGSPLRFAVLATRDPVGANLDRIQIVKGWVDAAGAPREKVFDVAASGARRPGPGGRVPAVGSSVDIASATYRNDIGAPELSALWQDPEFDAGQRAFYYARVLQIPTPRHSLYDAVALGLGHAADKPDTLQERAYTSPIWYHPAR